MKALLLVLLLSSPFAEWHICGGKGFIQKLNHAAISFNRVGQLS